jgi:dihydroflavonol-4-reductase
MKVLVTGGRGFVGSHSVKAIVDAGHDLRLLVRSPGRLGPALEPLGVRGVEHVVGDATDAESVRRAMDGCDAVVHAAAIFSYDGRAARAIQRVNARATEVVLGAARDAGLNPIVHVSSYVALLPPGGVLDRDSPVGDPRGVYARSKADTEQLARQLQGQGAPVVITYPGMVWGPHDPHLGEAATFARSVLRGLVPVVPPSVLPIVDVRDVAAAHAAILARERRPLRYMLAGGTASLAELIDLMRRVTGRRLVGVPAPAPLVLGMTAAGDVVQRVLPCRLPTSAACGSPRTEVRSTHPRRSGTSACASDRWRARSGTCFAGCIGPAT